MKTLNALVMISGLATAVSVLAAPPTADNYRGVIRGVMGKFDRDYTDLNPEGKPAPGALAIVETFLTALNEQGINKVGQYHFFMPENGGANGCNVAAPTCPEIKVEVRASLHGGDSTLFGAPKAFDWDVIVWTNSGDGFEKFLEGFYSRTEGTAGLGNMTVISCGGCSTVGHSQIEWDGTGSVYHLRSLAYDSRMDAQANPQVYGGVIVDVTHNPSSGDTKIAIAATNVCDSSATGDSICNPGGVSDHATGYAALLHANTKTGNVYVSGLQGANGSVIAPDGTDAVCIKADHSEDVLGTACATDGINNFTAISPYAPADAPASFVDSGSPWPMAEIVDAPTF